MSCLHSARLPRLLAAVLLCGALALASGCSWFGFGEKQNLGGTYRPYSVRGKRYEPLLQAENYSEEGLASWYGDDFHGRSTASGERYNMHDSTAAHKILPMNTRVRVTNLENGRIAIVRINDRGPFVSGRIIDVSHKAAQELDIVSKGTARVRIETLDGVPGYTHGGGGDMPGDFYVQIGSFTVLENAQTLLSTVKRRHPGSRMQQAVIGGKRFWRVQLGRYNGLAAAKRAQQSLERRYPSSFVIAD